MTDVLKLLMKLIKIIKKEIIIICIFFFTVIIDQITKFYIYENKFYFFEGVKLYSWLNLILPLFIGLINKCTDLIG